MIADDNPSEVNVLVDFDLVTVRLRMVPIPLPLVELVDSGRLETSRPGT